MHSLTNVPTKASGLWIRGIVDGEQVSVVCMGGRTPTSWSGMSSSYVGDHMLAKPEALRQMYANDLATAVRMGRDAGYAQAQEDMRRAMGIAR